MVGFEGRMVFLTVSQDFRHAAVGSFCRYRLGVFPLSTRGLPSLAQSLAPFPLPLKVAQLLKDFNNSQCVWRVQNPSHRRAAVGSFYRHRFLGVFFSESKGR